MSRWTEVAKTVANGVDIGPGAKVSIFATAIATAEAVDAFVEEVYRRGALPQVLWSDESFDRHAVEYASDETLATPAPLEVASMEWADVHVSFRGMVPPAASAPDPARLALQRKAKGIVSTHRWQQTRWALVRVPTPEWAALIGADFADLEREAIDGCLANWDARRADWQQLCDLLDKESECRITSADTDLLLPFEGRTWVPFGGINNFPDGEIATAPLETEVEGHITFPGTFWFAGTAITDLRLEFEKGRAVGITATEGQEFTRRMLSTDAGASRVGELGIGTNRQVTTMTGDLLIDEKIAGTVHIALGRAYPECGGVNESAIHWDIVKDLRDQKGTLTVGQHVLVDEGRIADLIV